MNPFEMVAVIVCAVMIASVLRARYQHRSGSSDAAPELQAEIRRVREEVQQLKDRIKVLERIAVEKENSLVREIEGLREHDRAAERDKA